MNKEFISYKKALTLREIGFDEDCFGYYSAINEGRLCRFEQLEHKYCRNSLQPLVTAILYQQAFRWFREKHELYQAIYADKRADDLTLLYKVHVYKLDAELSEYAYRWAKTYEEAELECIKQLIKIVTK